MTVTIARWTLIAFGIFIGIPYVLCLIGMANIADKYCRRL
jgi:hypothetical protein